MGPQPRPQAIGDISTLIDMAPFTARFTIHHADDPQRDARRVIIMPTSA
jgi:hypothetical protein